MKKVRLKDFAEAHRITERTVQSHIKKNIDVLKDHVERRGKHGTWFDEFAVNFLLDKIQLPKDGSELYKPTPRELQLILQLSEANRLLAEAERSATIYANKAGKVELLEEQAQSIKEENLELQRKVIGMEVQVEKSKELEAEIERLKAENEAMKNASLMARLKGWK